ncbi:MAG: sigma-70 family RNA polymerase sigma factor [Vicinamibacterales bacterium]
MQSPEGLADQFEAHRSHLRLVAYRMLGSTGDADDAVQEAWLRLSRSDAASIDNLRGWLTTVVARVCLDLLRARASRREDSLDTHVPDPIVHPLGRWDGGVETEAVRADALGLAVLVVLGTLEPAERLAFVLHDVCGQSFEEIAPAVERSVAATRQLASRARRRVRNGTRPPDADLREQRRVVEAFLAAVQAGDLQGLAAVLDPAIVLRADGGPAAGLSRLVRGADAVVAQAVAFSRLDLTSQVVLVNGHLGVVSRLPGGRLLSVIGYTVSGGRVVEMDILADPERLARLDLSALEA